MNFKIVRQKLLISSMMGVLCFMGQGIVSQATEVDNTETRTEEEIAEAYGEISYAEIDDFEYIRSSPSNYSTWVGKLYDGNQVTILSIEGTWAEIESGSVTGYISLEYLLEEDEVLAQEEELSSITSTVTASRLNVRTGPGMDYEIIDVVTEGMELLYLSEIDEWQLVYYDDNIGYVHSDYIEQSISYSYAESREEVEASEIDGEAIVEYAMQFIGNPYVWGGTDLENGADCSGFVQSVYEYFGIYLSRTSYTQRTEGIEVSYDEIELGDIICYEGHVGIYIGNDQIVNAIGSAYGIGISSATYSEIITIRRVL